MFTGSTELHTHPLPHTVPSVVVVDVTSSNRGGERCGVMLMNGGVQDVNDGGKYLYDLLVSAEATVQEAAWSGCPALALAPLDCSALLSESRVGDPPSVSQGKSCKLASPEREREGKEQVSQ